MIGIAQKDLGPRSRHAFGHHRFYRRRRPHGHECRRLDVALWRRDNTAPRLTVCGAHTKSEIFHKHLHWTKTRAILISLVRNYKYVRIP